MSAYHKKPEWAFDWPDFLPGPEDPNYFKLVALCVCALIWCGLLCGLMQ